MKSLALLLFATLILGACSTPPIRSTSPTQPGAPEAPATPADGVVAPQSVVPPAEPLPAPPTRSYTLGAATAALVNQAHAQLAGKNVMLAASTIERALRIEPNNPLLWLEYSQVRYSEHNYSQAESMARKALMLANGDPRTQSNAWRMIATTLRAQERNNEAQQADVKADTLAPK
ncbi:MAG TPA: hypothetical protein VHL14_02960 [Steroidobacteraceae bacterium]|nr:hypothetical protein [Steroidobacteraceae bacterium]